MCMNIVSACLYMCHLSSLCPGKTEVMELELPVVGSQRVGGGTQTWVLCKKTHALNWWALFPAPCRDMPFFNMRNSGSSMHLFSLTLSSRFYLCLLRSLSVIYLDVDLRFDYFRSTRPRDLVSFANFRYLDVFSHYIWCFFIPKLSLLLWTLCSWKH